MKKEESLKLERILAKIEHKYPSDNLITTYADFLKERNCLTAYKFNPAVLKSLLKLTVDLWESKERMSRISLITIIKKYINSVSEKTDDDSKYNQLLTTENAKLLFQLFLKVYEKNSFLTVNQREEALFAVNSCLKRVALSEMEEKWLCKHAFDNNIIINRILRYPVKSKIISEWAIENYNNNWLYLRKAELVGRIIDDNKDFEISLEEYVLEFEKYNEWELKTIKKYYKELDENNQIKEQLSLGNLNISLKPLTSKLPEKRKSYSENYFNEYGINEIDDEYQETDVFPNYEKLRENFYKDKELLHKRFMVWAIHYSCLDNKLKAKRIMKYYEEKTHYSIMKIVNKSKNKELINLLLNSK